MSKGLLGRKIGMTQIFDEEGRVVPVTVIEAGPCVVLQVRTMDRDGYEAVQLGFDDKPRRRASRSERGHVASIGGIRQKNRQAAGAEPVAKPECEPKKFVREFRVEGAEGAYEVGSTVTIGALAEAGYVDITGTSKGRGTAGVMKRHNFNGQGASHGVKRVHRHGGSIGSSADPSRVLKGTRMAGRYGAVRTTVRHLKVVRIDEATGMLLVRGAVPGPNGGYLMIRETNRR